MLDISDGLAVDAAHIAARSRVRCVIDVETVPLAEGATVDDLGFGEQRLAMLAANSIESSFLDEGIKQGLLAEIESVEP